MIVRAAVQEVGEGEDMMEVVELSIIVSELVQGGVQNAVLLKVRSG